MRIAKIVYYGLACLGLVDFALQAVTGGDVRLIRSLLIAIGL